MTATNTSTATDYVEHLRQRARELGYDIKPHATDPFEVDLRTVPATAWSIGDPLKKPVTATGYTWVEAVEKILRKLGEKIERPPGLKCD